MTSKTISGNRIFPVSIRLAKYALFLLLGMIIFSACEDGVAEKEVNQPSPEELARIAAEKAHLQFLSDQRAWSDSMLNALTLEEKIGQLFMVAAYSNKGPEHVQHIDSLISMYNLGGLIFFQGGPVRQALLTNHYQLLAKKVKLLIGFDGEWGLAMRLDSTIKYPRQMTLGAIQDDTLIYDMGAEIARQCKRVGIHVNFAPVVDVNNNPANPVIGTRSFGEDKFNVARKGIAYAKGMQHHGVIANAKHFPGHGDTDKDSHLTLPTIPHDTARLQSLELYPFRELIKDSVMSMMVAHLHIPSLDPTPNRATTLSPNVVNTLLKKRMGFDGLIFTDALSMKGVADYNEIGDIEVMALKAGNDVLLYPEDVPKAVKAIKKAIAANEIPMKRLDESVSKILDAKFFAKLHQYQPLKIDSLYEDLNHVRGVEVKSKLYRNAITVVKDENALLPLQLDSVNAASLVIGAAPGNRFQKSLEKYGKINSYNIENKFSRKETYSSLLNSLGKKDLVVVGLMGMNNNRKKKYGLVHKELEFLLRLSKRTKVVTVIFGNPYSLSSLEFSKSLICAYDDDPLAQEAVAQILFGTFKAKGKLPVTPSTAFKAGNGIVTKWQGVLGHGSPESVGINPQMLLKIDSIAKAAIKGKATPGCQILVAKDGIVVYHKPFGYQTYQKKKPIQQSTYYDLASLSKVLGTLQAVMQLHYLRQIDLNQRLASYLPELAPSNKGQMMLFDLLGHQAGLISYIPTWRKFVDKNKYISEYFSYIPSDSFSIEVADGLFGANHVKDLVWQMVVDSRLSRRMERYGTGKYLYSDLSFILLKSVVESIVQEKMDSYLYRNIYHPASSRLIYSPLQAKVQRQHIAPTEMDTYFRKMLVHGTVHDPTAALFGGVSGHAGLFGSALDVAKIMQMNLQKGYYNGHKFFSPSTFDYFNTRHFLYNDNRRGLGWDKPYVDKPSSIISNYCSAHTFGHTGFTGTCAWADPQHNLVYVFVSNRVYPTASNKKLIRERVRRSIHDIVYQAFEAPIVRSESSARL